MSNADKNFLIKQKKDLVDRTNSKGLDLDGINKEIYRIARVYLGLEELEKWFPKEEAEEKHKQPPLKGV